MKGVIVAGTDTGVGKTVCSALLALALDAHYWKPVQCGTDEETDSETIGRILGDSRSVLQERYRLHAPMSPDQAARREGIVIDEALLTAPEVDGNLVIETAGGVFVPLNDARLQVDLFGVWNLPVVLVARSALGTLNHTLLTLEALQRRGIEVAGFVLSGERHPENEGTLRTWTSVPLLGTLPPLERVDSESLLQRYKASWLPVEKWNFGGRE